MFSFQGQRKLWLAAAAAGLLAVAGCSSEPQNQANQATPAPKKASSAPANRPAAAAKAQPAPAKAAPTKTSTKTVAAKTAPAPKLATVPKGTVLSAKLAQGFAAESKNKVGDKFSATLASSVKVDGKTVIPKGSKITGHVVSTKTKKADSQLTVSLTSVEVAGKSYPLATNAIGPADQTRLKFKLAKSVKLPVKS
jgi:glucose/arabinose dehydrogenase